MRYWFYRFADWISGGMITYWHEVAIKKSMENYDLRLENIRLKADLRATSK